MQDAKKPRLQAERTPVFPKLSCNISLVKKLVRETTLVHEIRSHVLAEDKSGFPGFGPQDPIENELVGIQVEVAKSGIVDDEEAVKLER
jgi:hypothetical protein